MTLYISLEPQTTKVLLPGLDSEQTVQTFHINDSLPDSKHNNYVGEEGDTREYKMHNTQQTKSL